MKIRDVNPNYGWGINQDVTFIDVTKAYEPGFNSLATYLKDDRENRVFPVFHHFPEFSVWICQEQAL